MKRMILILAGFALIIAGCAEKPSMIVTAQQNDSQIKIAKGAVFQVKLESRLSTGYGWELVSGTTIVTLRGKPDVVTEEKDKTGGIDYEIFNFRADSPGETILVFNYRRPWIENEKPEKIFTVKVTVN